MRSQLLWAINNFVAGVHAGIAETPRMFFRPLVAIAKSVGSNFRS